MRLNTRVNDLEQSRLIGPQPPAPFNMIETQLARARADYVNFTRFKENNTGRASYCILDV